MKKVCIYLAAFTVAYLLMCVFVRIFAEPTFLAGALSVLVATAAGELASSSVLNEFKANYRVCRGYWGRTKAAWVSLLCVCE